MSQTPTEMDKSPGSKRRRSIEEDIVDSPDAKRRKSSTINSNEHGAAETYEHSVLNNIRNLVNDENLNDVVFIVENEELYGIRALFASQSIVFRQMLYGSMMESDPDNHVILVDVTIETFKYLRNSFYNISEKLTSGIVVDVLFAAQKYLIEPLVLKCINFIRDTTNIDEWYFILNKLESSEFQIQSKLYMNQIINNQEPPHILQYKSPQFVENENFKDLNYDTILILINSDNLAAKEHEIWESLLKWTVFNKNNNNKNKNKNRNEIEIDSEFEEKDEENININLRDSETDLMEGFIKYIRFNQMDAIYFKENIVDKMILSPNDIINIMFCRENPSKWKSLYNDKQRIKPKPSNTFQLTEVCLTLPEIQALRVGDLVDFRDIYGLFCSASIIEIEHNENKMKIHYNSWGSTYDEWYNYLSVIPSQETVENDNNNNNTSRSDARIRLTQKDKNFRLAKYGSITNRKIKRESFHQQILNFNKGSNDSNNGCQVNLPNLFWKKNQDYIQNKHSLINKWLNGKIIAYKSAAKYSDHIKIGIYINDDHFEYWFHPDNDEEVRQLSFNSSANDC